MHFGLWTCVLLACCLPVLRAQQPVAARNLHERLLCVVPLIGAGTADDPQRPLFAPARLDPASPSGIIAYSWQPSDDGKLAIVEFVARDRAAFRGILTAGRADVRAFVRGQRSRAEVETEVKRVRRDFALDQIGVVLP